MILVAAGMFIAYLITFFLMPFVIKIARINKLYDKPDERKTHTYPVSSLGGVGIVAGLAISLLLVMDFKTGESAFQYYLASVFIISILGVIDDIFVLHPLKKVAGQIIVAIILTTKAHLLITNLQGLGGFYEINTAASYVLTFFVILLIINSFNLIDGVDGLAGTLGLVASLFFALYFYVNGDIPYAILGFAMTGTLMAFLVFNFPPARIFMGDSGSMLIGVVNSILFIKLAGSHYDTVNDVISVHSPLALGFSIIVIPVLDVLRVFIIRLTKGSSPFAPDRNHIHHLLLSKGFSHTQVTVTILIAGIILTTTGLLMNYININLSSVLLTLLFFIGVFMIKYLLPGDALRVVDSSNAETDDNKVLALYGSGDPSSVVKKQNSGINVQPGKKKAE